MAFVIDASAMLGLILQEWSQERIDTVLLRLSNEEAIAPAILPFEIFNSLEMARRRGRIDAARIDLLTGYLSGLRLELRAAPRIDEAAEWRRIAERHGLTVYDASYLALAQSEGLDLLTVDTALANAAHHAGVMAMQP